MSDAVTPTGAAFGTIQPSGTSRADARRRRLAQRDDGNHRIRVRLLGSAWRLGFAPSPYIFTYLALAFAGLVCVLSLRGVTGTLAATPNWWSMVPATILIGIGASLFLPLKYAIPQIVPFWLDRPLADAERLIFAGDPWLRLDHLLGWAAVPIDRLYGLWLPTQSLLLFKVVTQPSSTMKSRALIAYVLAWFLLGVVAATVLSSAGPIFHDRILGGTASLLFARRYKVVEHGSRSRIRQNVGLSGIRPTKHCRRNFRSAVDSRRHQRLDFARLARDGTSRCALCRLLRRLHLGRVSSARLALRNGWARGIAWDAGYLVNQHQAAGVSRSPVWCLLSTQSCH